MNTLHIYKDYAPIVGGIENHLRILVEGLRACGVDTQVLVTNTDSTTTHEQISGVPVTKAGRIFSLSSAPISLSLYPLLYRLEENVDITHLHLPYPPGELGQLFLGRSRRLVLSYHSDIVRQKVLGTLYRPFLWQVLRRAHLIMVSNPAYMRTSPFLAPVSHKCRLVPYGIDLGRFVQTPAVVEQASHMRGRYGDKPFILFVGKLRHYKGLNVLLEAMHSLDAHLLVIGRGPMEQTWRRQVVSDGLERKVSFLGECSDEEVLAARFAADVFVLPSTNRAEALGIVQLEAMACGLPIVCTELGTGTSYVNQHGETGFVVAPGDAEALAAAIDKLVQDPDLRRQMGQAGLRRARDHFSKETMLARMIIVYQEVLQMDSARID